MFLNELKLMPNKNSIREIKNNFMESIFSEKQAFPQDNYLRKALGKPFNLWQTLENYVYSKYPTAMMEWSFSKSGGWSFRKKDNKRVIIYFLPRDQFFKVALVFGQKATD
jgi:hypothetical protein